MDWHLSIHWIAMLNGNFHSKSHHLPVSIENGSGHHCLHRIFSKHCHIWVWQWVRDVYLSASTSPVATVVGSTTTSGQTFQVAATPASIAGKVIAATLPLPASGKIVTVNVPATQGGNGQSGMPVGHHFEIFYARPDHRHTDPAGSTLLYL